MNKDWWLRAVKVCPDNVSESAETRESTLTIRATAIGNESDGFNFVHEVLKCRVNHLE